MSNTINTKITILRNGQTSSMSLNQFLNSSHYDLGHGEPIWFKNSYYYDNSKMFIGEKNGKPVFIGPYLAGDGIIINNDIDSEHLGEIKLEYPLPVLAGNAGKVLAVGSDGNTLVWVETTMEHGTTEYWDTIKKEYIPAQGRIVIYDDHYTDIQGVIHPGFKIGTGNGYICDLPFIEDSITIKEKYLAETNKKIDNHINNKEVHITSEERNYWNNKLNCKIDEHDEENIVFKPI